MRTLAKICVVLLALATVAQAGPGRRLGEPSARKDRPETEKTAASDRMKYRLIAIACFHGASLGIGADGPMPQNLGESPGAKPSDSLWGWARDCHALEMPLERFEGDETDPVVVTGTILYPVEVPVAESPADRNRFRKPSLNILIQLIGVGRGTIIAYEPVWASYPLPDPDPSKLGKIDRMIWWVTIGFTVQLPVDGGSGEAVIDLDVAVTVGDEETGPTTRFATDSYGVHVQGWPEPDRLRAMEDVFDRLLPPVVIPSVFGSADLPGPLGAVRGKQGTPVAPRPILMVMFILY